MKAFFAIYSCHGDEQVSPSLVISLTPPVERWDKNRHGKRTKSYLKEEKKKEEEDKMSEEEKVVEKLGHAYRKCMCVFGITGSKHAAALSPRNGAADRVTDAGGSSGRGNPIITIYRH